MALFFAALDVERDISARIPCVLSSCIVLVLVFPVCINQNQCISLSLVPC